jgi:flagellar motility protein MotE (MotC chaperone)
MINRSDIQDLLEKIKAQNKKLLPSEEKFLRDLTTQASHYGYTFSKKQYNWLKLIYEKR